MKPYKARNKRLIHRNTRGQFRKTKLQDLGMGGFCPECNHFLIHHYDGDDRDRPCDPAKFRYRCFRCEPLTVNELALKAEIEASKAKPRGLASMIIEAAEEDGV